MVVAPIVQDLYGLAGFEYGGDGNYYTPKEPWQLPFGYSDLVDDLFEFFTDMVAVKLEFTHGDDLYVLYGWKGDYVNLGAGVEAEFLNDDGIWQWNAHPDEYMPDMTASISYQGTEILRVDPDGKQVWAAGFATRYQDLDPNDLTATLTYDFSDNQDMFDSIANSNYNTDVWKVDPVTRIVTAVYRRRKWAR